MYRIIRANDGMELGITENVFYIKISGTGTFIEATQAEAVGIAYNGLPYNIFGHTDIEGADTVVVSPINIGELFMKERQVNTIAFVTLSESGSIDDVTASEHVDLFTPWEHPVSYTVGQLRSYKERLYRCVQAHTSQADWTPDTAVSLWISVSDPAEEYPEWSQPVGAHDAYMSGDKVSHNGKHWVSTADNNVWEPGVYGWDEDTGE